MPKDYLVSWLLKIEANSPEEAAQKAKRQADVNCLSDGFAFRVREARAIMRDLAEGEQIIVVDPTCGCIVWNTPHTWDQLHWQ